jgi:hypothetical protein
MARVQQQILQPVCLRLRLRLSTCLPMLMGIGVDAGPLYAVQPLDLVVSRVDSA